MFTVKLPILTLSYREDSPLGYSDYVEPFAGAAPAFEFKPVLKGIRVLIAEDEDDAREMLEKVLAGSGADVRACASAAEAFVQVQEWMPHVLVSDVGMPDEDGYSLLMRIRKLPADRGGRIPAMALTAYARVEDRVQAISAGFQTHAPKPVEPMNLVSAVATLAKRSPAYKEEHPRKTTS